MHDGGGGADENPVPAQAVPGLHGADGFGVDQVRGLKQAQRGGAQSDAGQQGPVGQPGMLNGCCPVLSKGCGWSAFGGIANVAAELRER